MILSLYKGLTRLAGLGAPLLLARRTKAGKEDPKRRHERLGKPTMPRPAGHLIWLHAASIGESVSILPLVERLLAEHRHSHIMVTTGTVSAATIMDDRLPERAFHQYSPLDTPGAVRGFLAHWRPDIALFVEQELWPNLITQTHASAIPMVLVNGRLSEGSARNWVRAPKSFRKATFGAFDHILAQDDLIADRFRSLTDQSVTCAGNLKYAARPLDVNDDDLNALQGAIGDRPVWVAASLHPGEEAHIVAVHKALKLSLSNLLTIIVPRHADKAGLFASACRNDHLVTRLRSQSGLKGLDRADVLIGDTMGEMGLYYRLAPVIFMGGSLIPHGGQNPLEPARLNRAILHGPHIDNFTDPFCQLEQAGGAIQITDGTDLAAKLYALLNDEAVCNHMGDKAAEIAAAQDNSLDHIMDVLSPYVAQSMIAGGAKS